MSKVQTFYTVDGYIEKKEDHLSSICTANHSHSYSGQVPIIQCGSMYYIDTLLLNEGIPRAYRGKKLRLKNILLFPSENNGK